MSKVVLVLAVTGFCCGLTIADQASASHNEAWTNKVVDAMLYPTGICSRLDESTGRFKSCPMYAHTQTEFFKDDNLCDGATKRQVFDWYLAHMSTSLEPAITRQGRVLRRASNTLGDHAIWQCRAMNYTNALPVLRANALGPSDGCRREEISTVLGWSEVDDETTFFVEAVVTNIAEFATEERNAAARLYAEKLLALDAATPVDITVRDRAVAMLYASRLDVPCSVSADKIAERFIDGYAISTGRLAHAEYMIGLPECWDNARWYFVSVTNQIHVASPSL